MTTADIPDAAVLLTLPQVAALSQMAPRTIRRYVSSGKFPAPLRPNGHNDKGARWVREEVMAWVERLKQQR